MAHSKFSNHLKATLNNQNHSFLFFSMKFSEYTLECQRIHLRMQKYIGKNSNDLTLPTDDGIKDKKLRDILKNDFKIYAFFEKHFRLSRELEFPDLAPRKLHSADKKLQPFPPNRTLLSSHLVLFYDMLFDAAVIFPDINLIEMLNEPSHEEWMIKHKFFMKGDPQTCILALIRMFYLITVYYYFRVVYMTGHYKESINKSISLNSEHIEEPLIEIVCKTSFEIKDIFMIDLISEEPEGGEEKREETQPLFFSILNEKMFDEHLRLFLPFLMFIKDNESNFYMLYTMENKNKDSKELNKFISSPFFSWVLVIFLGV